jgi:hypothetical protein
MANLRRFAPIGAALVLALTLAAAASAATITIINNDGPLEGFNDPTPAAPVGGNPGTTIGAQRLFVFNHAAGVWAGILPSAVTIQVLAQFDPLTCSATSGVLGGAAPWAYGANFPGAPLASHWYHVALANKLFGSDLDPPNPDIFIQFNSSLGTPTCLPAGWYYGVDGNAGTQTELLSTVLHEIAHGLGFSTPTNKTTGAYNGSFPGVYDHFLYDNVSGLHWDQMTAGQRLASVNTCNKLAWDGSAVMNYAPSFLGDKPVLRINSPAGIADDYTVGLATFGAPLSSTPVTQSVVLANDGDAYPTNACEALVNGAAIAGKIALVDRGTCAFTVKVKNAQNAGAIGVIVADSIPGCPPLGLGGTDPTVTIPSVRISQADGALIKANLAGGVNATLILDPALMAGADAAGRVLVYTPSTVASGSSVSHWDVTAEPSLLMEPFDTGVSDPMGDLTRWQFWDIGWFDELVAVGAPRTPAQRLESNRPNPFGTSTTIRFALDRDQHVTLEVFDLSGRLVSRLHRGRLAAGAHSFPWDGSDFQGRSMPPGIYLYTLNAGGKRESRQMVLVR